MATQSVVFITAVDAEVCACSDCDDVILCLYNPNQTADGSGFIYATITLISGRYVTIEYDDMLLADPAELLVCEDIQCIEAVGCGLKYVLQGVGGVGIQGPPGPTGATGPAGAAGPAGATGATGAAGAAGNQGVQGTPGNPGADGADGTNGTNGAQGPPGEGTASLYVDYTQTAHGFGALTVPFPVYFNTGLSAFVLAQADNAATAADGVVTDVSNPNVLRIQLHGRYGPIAHGFAINKWYVTSPTTPGVAVAKDALTDGDYLQYLFFAVDANNLLINVEPMDATGFEMIQDAVGAGMAVADGLSYDDVGNRFLLALSASAENQATLVGSAGLIVPMGAIDPSKGMFLYEEFLTGLTTSGTIGSLGWASSFSGTLAGVSVLALSTANRPGVVRVNRGSDPTGRSAIYLDGSAIWFSGGAITFETSVEIPTLPDGVDSYVARIGFGDVVTGDHVDGAYFECSQANANWLIKTANNSVRTSTTTTSAVVAGPNKLRIEVNAAGTSVEYFVSGVSVGTIATNIPITSGRTVGLVYSIIGTAGTASRSILPDYMLLKQIFTTPR